RPQRAFCLRQEAPLRRFQQSSQLALANRMQLRREDHKAISGLALGIVLWETIRMAERPEFKRIGASTYACTVCPNFKIEIVKRPRKMNAGELRKHLDARLVQHIQKYRSKSETA